MISHPGSPISHAPVLRKAALDDMGEADLTLALDSMSEANVDALTSSVEPNAVHQAITVDDTVEIAAAGERERMNSRALRHPNGRTQPQVRDRQRDVRRGRRPPSSATPNSSTRSSWNPRRS